MPLQPVLQKQVEPSVETTQSLSRFAQALLNNADEAVDFAEFSELNFGAPPGEFLPIKYWKQSMAKQCALNEEIRYVIEIFGDRLLREEVCRFLGRSKGLACSTEQLIVFSDTQTTLDVIARTLIDPGDMVVVENPSYCYARDLFAAYGAEVHAIRTDESGLVVDELFELDERCKFIYVNPSHLDTTGAVMPLERRKSLLSWARTHCDFIVEDGFDSDYFYAGAPLPALYTLDQTGRVLYMYNFWKLLFPLTAMGFLLVPPQLITVFLQTKQHLNRFFSAIEQQGLTDFIADGHLERHWQRTRTIYKKRRQAIIFALKTVFRDHVRIFGEGGGLHITAHIESHLSDDEIQACADAAELPVMSTRVNYAHDPVPHQFMIPFCLVPEDAASYRVARFHELLMERS